MASNDSKVQLRICIKMYQSDTVRSVISSLSPPASPRSPRNTVVFELAQRWF